MGRGQRGLLFRRVVSISSKVSFALAQSRSVLIPKMSLRAGVMLCKEFGTMPDNSAKVLGALLGIHAQTSLHPGTGTTLGTVDLPIQRERHTHWPTIAGWATGWRLPPTA